MASGPGFYRGKHFSEWVGQVNALKRCGDLAGVERLLVGLVKATESEDRSTGLGVAPWCYEQLAIIYRKQGDLAAELSVLERYENRRKAPGAGAERLAERLRKVRSRIDRT